MTDTARKFEPSPAEINDAVKEAGHSSLMDLIDNYKAAKARIAELERVDVAGLTPLKALLPDLSWYEAARRAAEAGRLKAVQLRGRFWFSTPDDVAAWLPTTKRWQSEKT